MTTLPSQSKIKKTRLSVQYDNALLDNLYLGILKFAEVSGKKVTDITQRDLLNEVLSYYINNKV